MARHASQAEYYRHHRQCFALALELGVTPKEAECELVRRETRERWADTAAKLQAKMAGVPANRKAALQVAQDERQAREDRMMMRD